MTITVQPKEEQPQPGDAYKDVVLTEETMVSQKVDYTIRQLETHMANRQKQIDNLITENVTDEKKIMAAKKAIDSQGG